MISLAGFQDALNAILVIIIISVVIAIAWLSTNVREQPLIATAVVVFQSGTNNEGNSNATAIDTGPLEVNSGGLQGSGASPVPSTSSVKENENEKTIPLKESESSEASCSKENESVETSLVTEKDTGIMEVPQKDEKLPGDSNGAGVMSLVSKQTDSDVVSDDTHSVIGAEALVLDQGIVQSCSIENTNSNDDHNDTSDFTQSLNLSCQSSSLSSENPSHEMEVRNRRLKHFVTMGGSQNVETYHDCPSSTNDESKKRTSPEKDSSEISSKSPGSRGELESSPSNKEERPPGSIKIRLKFFDETQKHVFAPLTEQVGRFKRQHFSIEMDANRRIRLIFNGQLLSQDTSTLAHYGLFDNCVVHCHVSQPQQQGTQNSGRIRDVSAQEDEDAYVTSLLAPLLYCVMVVMWYLRYEYSHLFNTMSTVILLFLTALLLISTYLLYITQNVPGTDTTTTQITTSQITTAQITTAQITTTPTTTAQISSHHQLDTNSLL